MSLTIKPETVDLIRKHVAISTKVPSDRIAVQVELNGKLQWVILQQLLDILHESHENK